MSRAEYMMTAAKLLKQAFPTLYCPIHSGSEMKWNPNLETWGITEDDFTVECPHGCVFFVNGVIRDGLLSLKQGTRGKA